MNTKETMGFDFGSIAADYDNWYSTPVGKLHDQQQKELVKRILPPSGKGLSLLEIGCGTGHWSSFFSSLGFEVTGVDVSHTMIDIACSKGLQGCRFAIGDGRQLRYQDESFDIIIAMAVLEFVDHPETIVSEMCRCLKSGTKTNIIIGTLNKLAPINRHRIEKGANPYAYAHMYSPKELKAILNRFGSVSVSVSAENTVRSELKLFNKLYRLTFFRQTSASGAFIVAKLKPWDYIPRLSNTAFTQSLGYPMGLYGL